MDSNIYPDEVFDFWLGFKSKVTKVVLLTADSLHAEIIAKNMDNYKKYAEGRGSTTFLGTYKDNQIMIVSSGLGTATTAVVAECLIKKGAKVIIRVGMAGSISDEINIGDIIIVTGAVRDDGISSQYLDNKYPTISDFEVTESLVLASRMLNVPYKLGVVWTHDAFFLESIEKYNYWSKLGAVCVDMETAGLFAVAQVRGILKGAILAISEPKLRNRRLGDKKITERLDESIRKEGMIALEAANLLIKRI